MPNVIADAPDDGGDLPAELPPTIAPDGDVFHFGADDGLTPIIEHFDTGDKIELDGQAFGLPAGALSQTEFHVGIEEGLPAHILYDPASGMLMYNTVPADDDSADLSRTFAVIQNKPALTASDFVVV